MLDDKGKPLGANATQVGGEHYQSKYQHWDFVYDCLGGEYLLGCATKYVARWRKKNGLQDLQKAQHYLRKLQEKCAEGNPARWCVTPCGAIERFCEANGLRELEYKFMHLAANWATARDLERLVEILDKLVDEAIGDVPW